MQPTTRSVFVVLLAIAVLSVPGGSPASAQSWIGSASLGVQVRGSSGAVEGARVEILYRGPGGESGGPAPRSTTGAGQASFTGLAEGVWSLEVSHPEHLSFIATLSLRRGRKAEATTSFLEASGTGRNPIRVKFFNAGQKLLGTPLQVAQAPEPAPPPLPSPSPSPIATDPPPAPQPTTDPADSDRRAATEPVAAASAPAPPVPEPQPEPPPVGEDQPLASTTRREPEQQPSAAESSTEVSSDGARERTAVASEEIPEETPPDPPVVESRAPDPPVVEVPEPVTPVEQTAPAVEMPEIEPSAPEPVETAETEEAQRPVAPPLTAPTVESPPLPEREPPPVETDLPAEPSAPPTETAAPIEPPESPVPVVPEPTTPPVSEPVAPEPTTPEPTTPELPVAEPAAELPPLPHTDASLRSFRLRTCFECKPGESAVGAAAEVSAAAGGAGCPADTLSRAESAVETLAGALGEELAEYAGNVLSSPVLERLDSPGAELDRSLLAADSSCRLFVLALPAGARMSGFRFEALEGGSGGDCLGDQPCPIGQSRWLNSPGIERSAGATLLWAVFENTSSTSTRMARIIAYFTPPSGWRP